MKTKIIRFTLIIVVLLAVGILFGLRIRSMNQESEWQDKWLRATDGDSSCDGLSYYQEAEQEMRDYCTNNIVGLSRVIKCYSFKDTNCWTGHITAEYVNHVGGIDRTNIEFRFKVGPVRVGTVKGRMDIDTGWMAEQELKTFYDNLDKQNQEFAKQEAEENTIRETAHKQWVEQEYVNDRYWTLNDGTLVWGAYVSSGTTTLVIKTLNGTNFIKISDLSASDQMVVKSIHGTHQP